MFGSSYEMLKSITAEAVLFPTRGAERYAIMCFHKQTGFDKVVFGPFQQAAISSRLDHLQGLHGRFHHGLGDGVEEARASFTAHVASLGACSRRRVRVWGRSLTAPKSTRRRFVID